MLRPATVQHPSRQRSRLVNRPFALPGIDGNSAEAREYRDTCLSLALTISVDPSQMTEVERARVRVAASRMMELRRLDTAKALGKPVDDEHYTRVQNGLDRALNTIDRLAKAKAAGPIGQTLTEYLAQKTVTA